MQINSDDLSRKYQQIPAELVIMVEKLPIAVAHISRPVMAKVFSYIL